MTIEDRIRRFVVDDLHGPSQLTTDYPLIERGVVDSLGIMHLVSFVESEYGVTVEDEELTPDNFATIRALANLVKTKTGSTGHT
jgi:acyl carrier protein